MKITDRIDIAGAGGMQTPDKTGAKVQGAQGGQVTPGDQVEVSDQAKEMGRLQAAVSNLPDVRPDRVEDVKNAVNTGTYNIKGEAVAGKMLKEAVIDSTI
ncbi:MAG: flagellar biosynthesis anti-sigma factor FlgM [Dissulfurispiraceae bacterium]|jgi:negative regulator of flagellin synthesis FlgM